jgi:hypothetical protein
LLSEVLPLFFRTETTAACFHRVGNYYRDKLRLKICLRTGSNVSVQPLIIKPGMSSTPTDLDDLMCLIALKTSESQTGTKETNSEHDERVGKITGQHNCCILIENSLKINQQHHEVRLNASCQSQAG